MNDKLISIIITCYNRENVIVECLESVKNQTYKNFECLVVDDGSTDNSKSIIKKLIMDDARFKLIESEHVGFPLAKNIGLDEAKGDYIIFLDSDDSAYPYWLDILYRVSQCTEAPIVVCGYDKYTGQNKAKESTLENVLRAGFGLAEFSYLKMLVLFHYSCLSYMWNKLIRRDLYEGIRHVDQMALSDFSVMYKIFDKANKVVRINLPLVHYRQHETSMSTETRHKGKEYAIFRFNLFKKVLIDVYNKYPQAGFICQIVLKQEINSAKYTLKKEFDSLVTLEDVKELLEAKPMRIVV